MTSWNIRLLRPGSKQCFGKFQKYFVLSRCSFCVFNICCVEAQTRKRLGDTEEILTKTVFRIFPRLRTHATYVEDVEFASLFASFPFCLPMQHLDQRWHKPFLQQFFFVCAGFSSEKAGANEEHCYRNKIAFRKQKMVLENFKNISYFEDAVFVSSTYVAWLRKRRNIWKTLRKKTLALSFSKYSLVCEPIQHMLKT